MADSKLLKHKGYILLVLCLSVPVVMAAEQQGRPNPFLPLSTEARPKSVKAQLVVPKSPPLAGLRGVRIADTSLSGVVTTAEAKLAILAAGNQSSYIVEVGSRLLDGTVVSISKAGLVFAKDPDSPGDGPTTLFRPFRTEPGK